MTVIASPISHSRRLRGKIEMVLPEMAAVRRALMDHPRLAERFPEYLFTTHCMIRASVPLMRAALGRSRELAKSDGVAAALVPFLNEHIPEELYHDDWLLDDLAVLGFDREELLKRPPSPTVASMVGSQYYWIFHYHPVALLGYIAIMEGYPPTVAKVDDLRAKTPFPAEAFGTLRKHAELDPHHRAELDQVLDSLPLTPEQSTLLGLSALQTVRLGSRALREVIER